MRKTVLFVFVVVFYGVSLFAQQVEMSDPEKKLVSLVSYAARSLSISKEVKVQTINSAKALEINIYLRASDENAVLGLGGVNATAVRTLCNEISIAMQRDDAAKASKPFKIKERKIVLINYFRMDG